MVAALANNLGASPSLIELPPNLLPGQASERVFEVYGCVVTCQDMVEHKDSPKVFDKVTLIFVFWFLVFC